MPLSVAEVVAVALRLYLAVGVVFAVVFVWRGAGVLDPAARAGSWGFRALILPGAAALWPVLMMMWARARSGGGAAADGWAAEAARRSRS